MEISQNLNPTPLDRDLFSAALGPKESKRKNAASQGEFQDQIDQMAWVAQLSLPPPSLLLKKEELSNGDPSSYLEYKVEDFAFRGDGEGGASVEHSDGGAIYSDGQGNEVFVFNDPLEKTQVYQFDQKTGSLRELPGELSSNVESELEEENFQNPVISTKGTHQLPEGFQAKFNSPDLDFLSSNSSSLNDEVHEDQSSGKLDLKSLTKNRERSTLLGAQAFSSPSQSFKIESGAAVLPWHLNDQVDLSGDERISFRPKTLRLSDAASGGLSGREFLSTFLGVAQDPRSSGESSSSETALNDESEEFDAFSDRNPVDDFLVAEGEVDQNEPLSIKTLQNPGPDLLGVGHLATQAPLSHSSSNSVQLPTKEMDAQVVPGALARDRLTTASVTQIGAEIKSFSSQGGGEIRLKLKPEHLGELTLKVSTQGSQVSLQVKAADERAKKIIGESLGALKENLSAQHLVLGSVDLSTMNQTAASSTTQQDQNSSERQSAAFSGMNFQDQNSNRNLAEQRREGNSQPDRLDWDRPMTRRTWTPPAIGSVRGSGSRQLDVTA